MLNKLKSAFFEEEAKPAQPQVQQPLSQQIKTVAQTPVASSARVEEFKKMLLEKVKSQSSTARFFEFLATVDDLKSALGDETASIKAAFVSLKRANVPPTEISVASQRVLAQLDTIKQNGERELLAECNGIIASKEASFSKTNNEITTIEKQIADLTSKVVELKTTVSALNQEIQAKKSETDSLVSDLSQAHSLLAAEFNGSITKIDINSRS
jgi:chromosome segregation ATPase